MRHQGLSNVVAGWPTPSLIAPSCYLTSLLRWGWAMHAGYVLPSLPSWIVLPDSFEQAKIRASQVVTPNLVYDFHFTSETPGKVAGRYVIADPSNPGISVFDSGFSGFSWPDKAEAFVLEHFGKLKRLHDGVIAALLHFQKTGTPVLEEWRPVSHCWESVIVQGRYKSLEIYRKASGGHPLDLPAGK